jgi:hypothetical protein
MLLLQLGLKREHGARPCVKPGDDFMMSMMHAMCCTVMGTHTLLPFRLHRIRTKSSAEICWERTETVAVAAQRQIKQIAEKARGM